MFSPPAFGTVTGIIGAITGPSACVISLISYRRSQKIKALDLRLELRKQMSDLRADMKALPALLEEARESRTAVRSAMGRGRQSGDNLIWTAGLENDFKALQSLASELPDAKETYQRSKPQELEDKLAEVHALSRRAAQLRNKYETALASDDKDRDRLNAYAHRGVGT